MIKILVFIRSLLKFIRLQLLSRRTTKKWVGMRKTHCRGSSNVSTTCRRPSNVYRTIWSMESSRPLYRQRRLVPCPSLPSSFFLLPVLHSPTLSPPFPLPLPAISFLSDAARESEEELVNSPAAPGSAQYARQTHFSAFEGKKIWHFVGYLASLVEIFFGYILEFDAKISECSMVFCDNVTTLTACFSSSMIIWGAPSYRFQNLE